MYARMALRSCHRFVFFRHSRQYAYGWMFYSLPTFMKFLLYTSTENSSKKLAM